MEIHRVTKAIIFAITSGADFFTISKASWLFNTDKTATGVTAYVNMTAEGSTLFTSAHAGTSTAVTNVAPAYLPVATRGTECGAIIQESLAWADANLMKGYEYFVVDVDGSSKQSFFVSGILNSTQSLSNDPFEVVADSFQKGACWNSPYLAGVNPFA